MDPAADLLEVWINQDKKTMTSRALARELGIAVSEAQTVLEAYAMSHAELHPTYLVTGRLLTSFSTNNGANSTADSMDIIIGDEPGPSEKPVLRQGIQLCTRKDLQAKRALFSPEGLRQTIYSLAPTTFRDPSALVECARTLRTHRMYHNPSLYGTIVCPSINAPPPPDIAPAKVKGSVNVAKPGSKPGGSNSKATAAAVPAKAAAGEEKKASAWDWTKKKPKEKEEEKKPSLKRKASPPPPRAKSATTVKRAVISSDDESKQPPMPAVKASAGKPTKAQIEQETEDLKGLWDDDDNVVVSAPTKKKAPHKRAVMSSSDDDDPPRAGSPKPPSKPKAKASSVTAKGKAKEGDAASKVVSASGRVRKLRRVVRTETRTNKRGYMETIDISGEESYSSDASSTSNSKPKPAASKTKTAASSKPPPAKKAAPASKPPPPAPAKKKVGGGGVGYQPSVASFFSKK